VARWFEYLEGIAGLGCPAQDEVERLAELKASRDVLVHNKGVANAVYVEKSMGRARVAVGDRVEISEHYHRESWRLVKHVIAEIGDSAVAKLGS